MFLSFFLINLHARPRLWARSKREQVKNNNMLRISHAGNFFLLNNFYYVKLHKIKRMKFAYLLPIGAGAVALYFWSKAQAGKNIKVYLYGLSLSKGTSAIPDIFAKFRIVNGSSTPVTLKSIVGDVFVNDKQIASVSNTESFSIPANKEVFYSVKLSPNVFTLVSIVWNLIKSKQRIKVTFNGTINTTGIMIPLNETIYQQN